ncbi:MAG: cytochrome c oxidase accessory protein CcoG [Planctomycetota bacterium]
MSASPTREQEALLESPEHVLSTLERDGSRRWLRPRLSMGSWWRKRRVVAYALMIIFVVIPHLRIGGRPAVLLDIGAREFTILGKTFLPTDTLLLAFLMLTVLVTIVLVTAIAGRVWCGWACPQTVYMEFLFRPIDRFFEGTAGRGGTTKRPVKIQWKVARFAVYLLLCGFLSHTFLAYFIGTERLSEWIRSSPTEHPLAFLVMSSTLGLMLFDFMLFREQMCLIACPYGRFQSVMLDEQSMIVAYDEPRGEPRKKGRRRAEDRAGDCIDCKQCVAVCPTGIDIRDGLQMECINCTQCIDACDNVMERIGLPTGLIRYSSKDTIAGKAKKLFRARTIIYPIILLLLMSGLVIAVSTKAGFDARIIRHGGAPFTVYPDGTVSNEFRLRLVNRTKEAQHYVIEPPPDVDLSVEVLDQAKMILEEGDSVLVPIHVTFETQLTRGRGRETVSVKVFDENDHEREVELTLLGPR